MSQKGKQVAHADIILAIEASATAAKLVAETVAKELVEHTKQDDKRFEEHKQMLLLISIDIKSLLAHRAFTEGFWKAVTMAGGLAVFLVAIIELYIRWWRSG